MPAAVAALRCTVDAAPIARCDRSQPVRSSANPRRRAPAVVFADAALRRVLEVIDRRRPVAQLRPLVAPALIDVVIALTRTTAHGGGDAAPGAAAASVDDEAAEVFGTFTRGAARPRDRRARRTPPDRWRIVALQIG